MSGGYLGIGATLTKRNIADKVKDRVSIYSTYGWHPRSTIAALAVLDLITRNEKDFFSHVEKRSQQFRTGLSQLPFKKNGKLSMIGLAIAVDVEENSYAGKIRKKAFEKGLIIGVQGSQLVLFPSLTITIKTVSSALRILEDSV